jgi:hypothetical protein
MAKGGGMKYGLFNPFFGSNDSNSISAGYQAILTAASALTLPTYAVQSDQNTLYVEILSVLSDLDGFFVLANNSDDTQTFSTINWCNPTGTRATYSTTGVGTITFDRRGALGSPSGAYIDTGVNPSATGSKYTLDSAFEAVYVWKASTAANNILAGNVTATSCSLRNASTTAQRLNSGGNVPSAIDLSGTGFKALNRDSASDLHGWADLVETDRTISSFALPNETRKILRQGSAYGDAGIAIYVIGRGLSDAKITILRNAINKYITNIYRKNYLSTSPINLYFLGPPAQSNLTGRGDNTQAATELRGKVGSKILRILPTPPGTIDSTSNFQELEMGANNTTESLGSQHGLEMRFGYNMYQLFPDTWIVKFGVGGTSMAASWNKDGSSYRAYIETILIDIALPYLRYTLRRPFTIRGVISFQGESDSSGGLGAAYGATFDAMIVDFVDRLNNAGYKTDKLRWYDCIPKYSAAAGYNTTDYNNMVNGKISTITGFATNHASYMDTKIKGLTYRNTDDMTRGDNEHLNASGLDSLAVEVYNYFRPYVNE